MPLHEKALRIIEKYSLIEDPQERLAALVSAGRKWPAPLEEEKTDAHRVHGCVSKVWLAGSLEDGVCRFRLLADSPLVQGLGVLVCQLYDGSQPREILECDPDLLGPLGLERQISPTRLNGLASLKQSLRAIAASHLP